MSHCTSFSVAIERTEIHFIMTFPLHLLWNLRRLPKVRTGQQDQSIYFENEIRFSRVIAKNPSLLCVLFRKSLIWLNRPGLINSAIGSLNEWIGQPASRAIIAQSVKCLEYPEADFIEPFPRSDNKKGKRKRYMRNFVS